MTEARYMDRPDDAELVAYLDGELPPHERARIASKIAVDQDLQRRLILLSGGNRPFREAFATLLEQAPKAKLEAMLSGLPASKAASTHRSTAPRWRVALGAVAAGLLLFFAGLGADRLFPNLSANLGEMIPSERGSPNDDDWRQAVAEYLTLYTSETLASIPDDAGLREHELSTLSAKMGLALSSQRIALPNLSFKRAQLFDYEGKPLGQIAYLDRKDGPIALCIVADGAEAPPKTEQRQGFNIVHWSRNGHGFMLIGKTPLPRLREFADDLSRRLTG
jgi:anti-sigma factor RsiW